MLSQPFDKLRIPTHRNGMQLFAIESPHVTVSGLAELGCPLRIALKTGSRSPGEL